MDLLTANWTTRSTKLRGDHGLRKKNEPRIDISKLNIVDLIGPQSKAIMEQLKLSYRWNSKLEYEQQKQVVSAIVCVNDACERAVKLAGDKNSEGPKSEIERQNFYLVVNEAQKMSARAVRDTRKNYKESNLKVFSNKM